MGGSRCWWSGQVCQVPRLPDLGGRLALQAGGPSGRIRCHGEAELRPGRSDDLLPREGPARSVTSPPLVINITSCQSLGRLSLPITAGLVSLPSSVPARHSWPSQPPFLCSYPSHLARSVSIPLYLPIAAG